MIILLTSGDSLSGGAGTYASALSSAFPDVNIASNKEGLSDFYVPGFSKVPNFSSVMAMREIIKSKQCQTIICQSTGSLLMSIILRVMFPRLRIINVYHGLASGYEGLHLRILEIISAFFSTKVVVTNLSDGRKIFNKKKQVYIPNCTTKDGVGGVPDMAGPVISVTRWSRQKNNSLLKEFFKISDINFYIYSKKSDHESFKSIFSSDKQLCLYASSKHQIYNNKSVFILSTYSEGFPLSVLEAASSGIPIAVSKIDLLIDLLGDNAQYFSTASELKEITDKLRCNQSYFDEWSKRSLQLSKEYSWERWRDNWSELLDSVTTTK